MEGSLDSGAAGHRGRRAASLPCSPKGRLNSLLDRPWRTWVQLIAAAMLPLLLFGSWVAYVDADRARVSARQFASDTAWRVAKGVSAELSGQMQVLQALATSTSLDQNDLWTFREELERTRDLHPLWFTVELSAPSGVQILNLLRPAGQTLGPTADRDSFDRIIRTKRPVVGGIGPVGPISGRRLVTLRVPVLRDSALVYVLSVAIAPDSIGKILREAGAPATWIGVIVDASGRVVARTLAEGPEMGQLASAVVRQVIAREPSGFFHGHTLEGVETDMVFRELPDTDGWTVHFDIPSEILSGPVHRSLWLLAVGGIAGLALACLLVAVTARDVALRRAAERMRAYRALTATEQRLATAVHAADLGTWRWDSGLDSFQGSERCRRLLGLTDGPADPPTGRLQDAWAAVHPADRPLLDAALRVCVVDAAPLDVEFRVKPPGDGNVQRWIRMNGRRQDASDLVPPALQGVVADISARKHAEAERLDLLRRLAQAQEDERRRISRELHDQVGQTVTGLALGLKALEASLGGKGHGPEQISRVAWLRSLAAEIGRDIHRAAADLRPSALDDFGLDKAVEALAADWGEKYGVAVDVQVTGEKGARLSPEVEIVVYRVVQEALTNVLKHADARGVSVVLDHARADFRVIVEDDGRGFDVQAFDRDTRAASHFGLLGMRERLSRVGGTMMTESAPGAGTTVFIDIPLSPNQGRGAS